MKPLAELRATWPIHPYFKCKTITQATVLMGLKRALTCDVEMRDWSWRAVRSDEDTLAGAPRWRRILTFLSRSAREIARGDVFPEEVRGRERKIIEGMHSKNALQYVWQVDWTEYTHHDTIRTVKILYAPLFDSCRIRFFYTFSYAHRQSSKKMNGSLQHHFCLIVLHLTTFSQ